MKIRTSRWLQELGRFAWRLGEAVMLPSDLSSKCLKRISEFLFQTNGALQL